MIISLMGFMGCGKSSVGRRLSALLSCSYADLDAAIEESCGRKIPDIFAVDGEAVFRSMELKTLRSISETADTLVLSLGGGTVMTPECEKIIHERTLCIYLKASAETLVSHLQGETEGRPILAAARPESLQDRIRELMTQRSGTYDRTAHIVIDTDGKSIGQIAEEAVCLIQSHVS